MTKGKFDLAIAVALVPLLGTGLVLMNQLGRYLYYGVPPEMLELDAYNVLFTSLSMLFIGSALLYAGATLYDPSGTRAWQRMCFHLIFATILTAPFWYKELDRSHSIPWPAVVFAIFTGTVTFGAERWLKRKAKSRSDQLSGWALVAFFTSLFVLVATCGHGYLSERDKTLHTFVASSNDAVIGRVGDLLILKTYDPTHRTFVHERTKLMSVDASLILETRTIQPRQLRAEPAATSN